MKFWNIFKKKKQPVLSLGERSEDGYVIVFSDGKPTNLRLVVFTQEQFNKLKNAEKLIKDDFIRH